MRETWYVVPASFALRGARDVRDEENTEWILPEGWRKTDSRSGLTEPMQKPRVPRAPKINS